MQGNIASKIENPGGRNNATEEGYPEILGVFWKISRCKGQVV